jgi:hypothetical protein
MASPADLMAIKRGMRRLYNSDPSAFEEVMEKLLKSGRLWRGQLPPMETVRGKPKQVNDGTLAALLADYRNRPSGVSREKFLGRLAAEGCQYGNAYFTGKWRDADTILTHLKAAERKVKSDAVFAGDVEFWQEVFAEENIGSVAWGESTGLNSP